MLAKSFSLFVLTMRRVTFSTTLGTGYVLDTGKARITALALLGI